MAKINKALDYNKLKEAHDNGKLLKKFIRFPLYASIKYDGNYTVVVIDAIGNPKFVSSGGHIYDNNSNTIFDTLPVGVYIAERIVADGKLGDRRNCALRGSRGCQTAYDHNYKVHDFLTIEEYEDGISFRPYTDRLNTMMLTIPAECVVNSRLIANESTLEAYLKEVTKRGYEGLMLKHPNWYWEDTKSRKPDLAKYKKRPTVDLLCVDVKEGEGKYVSMIGSLTLVDSKGRKVSVGSGLSDEDRHRCPLYFIGVVIEVEYEQIIDTYIQPSFICRRKDKSAKDID